MIPHSTRILRILSICIALAFLAGVSAQAEPRMSLVGPGVGWAVLNQPSGYNLHIPNHHLFWTSDDGANWKDITPQDPASHEIAGVFFLDASRGWVLFALTGKEIIGASNISGFDLAATGDGGANWRFTRVTTPREDHGWAGAGEVFFLDPSHGWLNLELALHDWAVGTLLATTDGGDTWNEVRGFNVDAGYGPIRFTDLQNGWIAGGPYGQQHLYATHDGGSHWHDTVLPPPSGISGYTSSTSQCSRPFFRDAKHGFVSVTYAGTDESGNDFKDVALFSTDDTGRTWRLENWINLGEDRGVLAFTAVDSLALAPKLSGHTTLTLIKLGSGGKVTETRASESPEVPSTAALLELNFSDTAHGWASVSDGDLLSTTDGAATWKDITPGRKKTSTLVPRSNTGISNSSGTLAQSALVASSASGTTAASSTTTTYKSRHLGFDRCGKPTPTQMGIWWTSSPYFDYGVYAGGVNTTCTSVTSSWVKTVTGQGWVLIPIWFGPQAPCTCKRGTWPTCTTPWTTTIDNMGGAYAQGQAEADAATGRRGVMPGLGLGPGSPVYFDIENYSHSANCNGPTGSYVNAFLDGWVSEIHNNGYIAAVYGNTAPAASWYSGGTGYGAVSPSPDDVWIANYNNANSNLTIWGLTSSAGSLTDAAWAHDQRMRQYFGDQYQTWGGQQFQIDGDIEDADVVGGNGAKSYSFTYTTLPDFPGATNTTTPEGINNSGKIVGFYSDPATGLDHGYLYDYYGGTFTSICPNATQTQAYGINNAGSIVGLYVDLNGTHGFLYQAGSCNAFDYPNAVSTLAFGINDATQISGYYTDSLGGQHGFLYQPSNTTPFTPFNDGSSGTNAYGINGDAQIAGGCLNPGIAFLYFGGTFSSAPVDCAAGVNNNEQISGSLGGNNVFEHEGSYITIAYPGASSTNASYSPSDYLILNSQPTAKVALVGSYYSSVNGFHGFLATSQ
jgi:photosystem II stability/assembly factor-like uncharacterized protein